MEQIDQDAVVDQAEPVDAADVAVGGRCGGARAGCRRRRYSTPGWQEGIELITKIQNGNMEAWGELLENYRSWLTGKISRRTQDKVLQDELFQDCSLALLRAAQKFDTSRGVSFVKYLNFWVLQAIGARMKEINADLSSMVHYNFSKNTTFDSEFNEGDLLEGIADLESPETDRRAELGEIFRAMAAGLQDREISAMLAVCGIGGAATIKDVSERLGVSRSGAGKILQKSEAAVRARMHLETDN